MKYSKIFDWNCVPSKLNPADKASRGLTAEDLLRDDVWFSGAEFLKDEPSKWPETIPVASCDDGDIFRSYDLERNVRKCKVANHDTGSETVIVVNVKQTKSAVEDIQPTSKLILHFSSLYKLKLAVSWLCRFMQYFVSRSQNKDLSIKARAEADELVIAEMRLSFKLKHPIILPEHDHLTMLIIQHAHSKSVRHGGVNLTLNFLCQRYWIVNAKVCAKRVLSQCVVCKRINSRSVNQHMADLPKTRLQIHEPPFSHVGVDYFGPHLVKMKRSVVKRYGRLFTCMTTRAIHLEVAYDLSTSAFINASRRFVSRRGPVQHIFSDIGTNFVGSARLLRESMRSWNQSQIHDSLCQINMKWTFNPPSSSHMGGVWERMIRSVRTTLMSIMPKQTLYDDDLTTLFAEVEAILKFSTSHKCPSRGRRKYASNPKPLAAY